MDSICGTARAKSLRLMAQLESPRQAIFARPTALRRAQKCARPDRGCPGGSIRSMQGGWGAQHRSDIGNFLFWPVEFGDSGLDTHWCCGLGGGFNVFFENVDPPQRMAHFSAQLEAVSRSKKAD